MKKNLQYLICLAIACGSILPAIAQQPFRVMEYNVENLFDCRHDSLKEDTEFLPEAVRHWSYSRYRDKLAKIAKVIAAAGEEQVPDLVALCEVENRHVLKDLIFSSPLKEAGYRYVMTDSPDQRGIDVALLYQPGTFRLLSWHSVRIPSKQIKRKPTRDILHVTGKVLSGDTLDVFVCHMPSRSSGQKESEPYRLFTASILKAQTDSLLQVRATPNILITGDFNDMPTDSSLSEVLNAMVPVEPIKANCLYNLMAGRKKEGTYRYHGEWNILDQMIVLGRMLTGESALRTSWKQAQILKFPFLLETDERYGGVLPFRTYYGMRYKGGYSDHLPLLLEINIDY